MKLKRRIDAVRTTTEYETSIIISPIITPMLAPYAARFEALMTDRSRGRRIGKDSTGYNVPFESAFAMIEAITVDETTRPKFPRINTTMKVNRFRI